MEDSNRIAGGRIHAVDWLKAAAIVAVVLQHSILPHYHPRVTSFDLLVRWVVQFHVPVFLMVSGYLAAVSGTADTAVTRRRLVRVLVPYAIASFVMYALGYAKADSIADVGFGLATGSALGIYYYVVQIVVATIFLWAVSRLGPAAIAVCWLGLLVYLLWKAASPPNWGRSVFWILRDPVSHFTLGFFLAGWLFHGVGDRLGLFSQGKRIFVCGACLLVGGGFVFGMWLGPAFGMAVLAPCRAAYSFAVAAGVGVMLAHVEAPRAVRALSENSYPIYLYHLPFVLWVSPYGVDLAAPARVGLIAGVTLLGAWALAWSASRLLGRQARLLVGV